MQHLSGQGHQHKAEAGAHHESLLFLGCLEATMSELGSGVDELEVDLLQSTTVGLHKQRLHKKREIKSSVRALGA